MFVLLCSIIFPNQACLVTGKDCSEAVLTLKNSISFYFFIASHLMGHDDNFQNALNCKRFLQNRGFLTLIVLLFKFQVLIRMYCTVQSRNIYRVPCAKENTNKETKKKLKRSFIFMRLFRLQSPT